MDTHPVLRLPPGSPGFTSERVRSCLINGLSQNQHKFVPLNLDYYEWDLAGELAHSMMTGQRQARCRAFCHKMAAAMQKSTRGLELLDEWLASWTESNYILPHGVNIIELVEHTMQVLQRLPACSTSPPESLLRRQRAECSTNRPSLFDSAGGWEAAPVAKYLDSNTIHVALHTAINSYHIKLRPHGGYSTMRNPFREHLDNLTFIMEESHMMWVEARHSQLADCFLELTAFVWTAWQRSLTLALYDLFRERMSFGYVGHEAATARVPFLAHCIANTPISSAHLTPYVCPWAFGLIRQNAYACGGDFRTITRRCDEYCQELNMTLPRCIFLSSGHTQQCSGDTLEECNRFTGLCVQDQSSHAGSCHDHDSCAQNRLLWDSVSYGSVLVGRAVSVTSSTNNGLLQYCSASELTLTVSHVWSHGQGGRPDIAGSGMNRCLHERYCRLALAHECDSYWIDTACIPSDHTLRKEAISEINRTFSDSKVTLICDKDIMRYDIAELTVAKQERILSMLLLCDWNLRAWTFLEAMRGRSHLHLLCKDEKTISVRFLLEEVLASGSLDLLGPFSDAHHLVPNRDRSLWHVEGLQGLEGIVSTEVAACLLSRRHASRGGDDVVIWSLLCGGPPHQTAEAFWQQHQAPDPVQRLPPHSRPGLESHAKWFNTAFLVSTAPRMQIEGLRWAPARPSPEPQMQLDGLKQAIYPVVGLGSEVGRIIEVGDRGHITEGGFESTWYLHEWKKSLNVNRMQTWWKSLFRENNEFWEGQVPKLKIEEQYLSSYRYCALLRTVTDAKGYKPSRMRIGGAREQELVVVAGCNRLAHKRDPPVWTWLGVIAVPVLPEGLGRVSDIILN